MISKPLMTMSRFSGMNRKGGLFYIDGFSISNENGVLSIDENYGINEILYNIEEIKTATYIYPLTSSKLTNKTGYTLMFSGTSFYTADDSTGVYKGKIIEQVSSGDYKPSKSPDILQLENGNLIFTSSRHLGLIVRGLAKSGSGTTKIIDKAGRNLSTLGVSNASLKNRVVNLRTGAQYTITSLSTTDSTNDTINFSAGTENQENDEFMIFIFNYKDLNDNITLPSFAGQQSQEYWARPIQQLADKYLIANGNYIAVLSNDAMTLDSTYKLLPPNYNIIDLKTNDSDHILISAVDNQGRGHLLLWDGVNDNWQQIINIDTAPKSIYRQASGWIYLLNGTIFYTDGLNISELISFPDTDINTSNFNCITSYGQVYYFAVSGTNRANNGVLVFDPNYGLYFFKTQSNGASFKKPYCVKVKTRAKIDSEYETNPILEVFGDGFYNQVLFNSTGEHPRTFISFIDLQQEQQIKEVWLGVKRNTKLRDYDKTKKYTKITINYGTNNEPIYSYGKVNIDTKTTAKNTQGNKYGGVVGQVIELISGASAGERTYIKAIRNAGTINEEWDIEQVNNTGQADYRAYGLFKSETKTIEVNELTKPVRFPINLLSDKFWLEVVVEPEANSFPVSINSINIF